MLLGSHIRPSFCEPHLPSVEYPSEVLGEVARSTASKSLLCLPNNKGSERLPFCREPNRAEENGEAAQMGICSAKNMMRILINLNILPAVKRTMQLTGDYNGSRKLGHIIRHDLRRGRKDIIHGRISVRQQLQRQPYIEG